MVEELSSRARLAVIRDIKDYRSSIRGYEERLRDESNPSIRSRDKGIIVELRGRMEELEDLLQNSAPCLYCGSMKSHVNGRCASCGAPTKMSEREWERRAQQDVDRIERIEQAEQDRIEVERHLRRSVRGRLSAVRKHLRRRSQ